jgi:Siphovirus Gp157
METSEFTIRRETEAAKALLAGMRETIGEGDMALLADTIEGETNLLESIDVALSEIDETEVLISGLKEKEGQFSQRRRAMEERVRRFRALIEQAMAITEQGRLRRPSATLTLRRLPPDVVVTTEADIPAEFFVPQPPPPPKLDKAALKQALKRREAKIEFAASLEDVEERVRELASIPPIPGATLNNGSVSLQIRRS